MKIALAQLNYHIGNFAANNKKIIHHIQRAKTAGADLIVFAELAIGGYPAKDLLRNTQFIQQCRDSLQEIAQACQGIHCIIGAPVPNTDPEGKPLYNAAAVLADGKIQHICKKSLLPDYDVFDETVEGDSEKETFSSPLGGLILAWNYAFYPKTINQNVRDYEIGGLTEKGLQKGAIIEFVTPSPWAYDNSEQKNKNGEVTIPANSPLHFKIEVVDIKDTK